MAIKIKILLTSICILGLTACSMGYSVSTNVDKSNFKQYFSPAKVRIYQNESQFNGRATLLGIVEGEDCQVKAHHRQPDKVEARTQARRKAYQMHANAIVFTGCALIEKDKASKQCLSSVVCYGKAYQVVQHD
jgi:RcsF protein